LHLGVIHLHADFVLIDVAVLIFADESLLLDLAGEFIVESCCIQLLLGLARLEEQRFAHLLDLHIDFR
jgi:hypothetical protein